MVQHMGFSDFCMLKLDPLPLHSTIYLPQIDHLQVDVTQLTPTESLGLRLTSLMQFDLKSWFKS